MRMQTLLTVGFAIALVWSNEAVADILFRGRNVDTDTTVFLDDGFEDETIGSPPTQADVGNWQAVNPQNLPGVTDAVDPGAYSGDNYLHIARPAPPSPQVSAVFSEVVSGGDTVEFSFAINRTAGDAGVRLFYGGNTEIASIQANPDEWRMRPALPAAFEQTGIASTPGEWQEVTIAYDTGGGLLRLTVDGSSYDYMAEVPAATNGIERAIFLTDGGSAVFYLDGTSSAALAGDLNGDGFVGQDDLNLVLASWGQNVSPGDPADPSGDEFVGQDDLNPVLADWGQGTPPPAVGSVSAVPEPGSLTLLIAALLTVFSLHRHGLSQLKPLAK